MVFYRLTVSAVYFTAIFIKIFGSAFPAVIHTALG